MIDVNNYNNGILNQSTITKKQS